MQLIFLTLFAFKLIRHAESYGTNENVSMKSFVNFDYSLRENIANITDEHFVRVWNEPGWSAKLIQEALARKYSNGTWVCMISEADTYNISMSATGISSMKMTMKNIYSYFWRHILVIHIPATEAECKDIGKECPTELPCLPADNPTEPKINQKPAINQEPTTNLQPTIANSAITNRLLFLSINLIVFSISNL
uniref:Uncharacterized protein n=1 Tax=Ditylenchus dipsaci TaxID=166011 RepID=A0A915E3G2_9BILA